ncbi:exopolysaccharide biosynthesis protein [Halomonas sp. McH1-25]|uniref:exopolysaccharide biosynthesis protein n=1 Tax=unclassified Halomonas TaxID=2609666 RepID=UPI001EF694BA|nr:MULTISPECIES: exopolysaccharide biosynthesis protein [unclassified Halomonas]MCG7598761.1 exopolysaccharide biosynthesis protein [Halomonas sp. McH1-25]MCP1340724.1 exopolysaccharide biosynthesis protein [Halomonas sp. FL8]MCP1359495.1 exopolysaccharide biosynthesis protein [Halomonas sp. BBD45]MCP1364130.1 exopolysaccharide biosynthesis protein [Halomonas sp. BBD48]
MDDEIQQISTLEQLLDRLEASTREARQVSLEMIVEAVGSRSFGPLLLVAGLITLAPLIGDIPGVPTIMGILVLLVSGQLLVGRRHFWLPKWLLGRSVESGKFTRGIYWVRRPARVIDKLLKPRLVMLVHGAGLYAVAATCCLIALAMPLMEVVPFSANGAGAALTLFGLALIARDGLLVLIGFVLMLGTAGLIIY